MKALSKHPNEVPPIMGGDEIERWRRVARRKGWSTYCQAVHGPICRGCHNECISGGSLVWLSPKGSYYHRSCAIKTLQKEEKVNVTRS